MEIQVNKKLFEIFPRFCRGVVVGTGLNNRGGRPELEAELQEVVAHIQGSPAFRDFRSHERIAAWCEAFRLLGMNPNRIAVHLGVDRTTVTRALRWIGSHYPGM